MNVQLQIGGTYFHMNVTEAAKVMEALGKATMCDTYWVDGESGLRVTSADMQPLQITQIAKAPITEAEYRAKRDAYDAKRDAEKAASEA